MIENYSIVAFEVDTNETDIGEVIWQVENSNTTYFSVEVDWNDFEELRDKLDGKDFDRDTFIPLKEVYQPEVAAESNWSILLNGSEPQGGIWQTAPGYPHRYAHPYIESSSGNKQIVVALSDETQTWHSLNIHWVEVTP